MAEEAGAFDFGAVVEAITAKLVRRHPHVFGDVRSSTPQAVEGLWERIKAQEKAEKAGHRNARSEGALAGVPVALPALTRALKLQDKAGRVGFDWDDPHAVLKKIREEADEIEAALAGAEANKSDASGAADEVGDLLPLARRSGSFAAAGQPEIRAPLCQHRTRPCRARKSAAGRNARGNGCALGGGEGC
jgi:ATP diphosphatase